MKTAVADRSRSHTQFSHKLTRRKFSFTPSYPTRSSQSVLPITLEKAEKVQTRLQQMDLNDPAAMTKGIAELLLLFPTPTDLNIPAASSQAEDKPHRTPRCQGAFFNIFSI